MTTKTTNQKEVTLTRQRIVVKHFNMTSTIGSDPEYRKNSFRWGVMEDQDRNWADPGWGLVSIEIVSTTPDPNNAKYAHNKMEIVKAVVTERKVVKL